MRAPALRLFAAVLVAACADQPTIPPDITVQVLEPVVWAGTDWVLQSPGFAQLGSMPTITLDDSVVTATAVDDTTIAVRAPAHGGTHVLRVQTPTQSLSGIIEAAGYLGTRTTIPLGGWPLQLDPGSLVMYAAAAESTVARVNVVTGLADILPVWHRQTLVLGPGPSYHPNGVIATSGNDPANPSTGQPRSWLLPMPPAVTDSAPFTVGPSNFLIAELAPGVWLRTAHHSYRIVVNGVASLPIQLEEAERAVFSPDRSLVAVTADGPGNPPVLDAATGAVRYQLPWASVGAVAFTAGGDSLFVVGKRYGLPAEEDHRLVVLVAASGQELTDVLVPPEYFNNLVLDPRGRWIYLTPYGDPSVTVLDRATLASVARLHAPVTCPWLTCSIGQVGTGVDPAQRRLHVLGAMHWGFGGTEVPTSGVGSPIVDFSLPPVSQAPLTLVP